MSSTRIRIFSLKELATYDKYNAEGLHYFGLFGNVYDAGKFSHPGGPGGDAAILNKCGDVIDDAVKKKHPALTEKVVGFNRQLARSKVGVLSEKVGADNPSHASETKSLSF